MATGESIPLRCLEGSPAFLAHVRMKPASLGNLRLALWVVPHAERPQFPGPLLKRTRCPDTSLKATLCMKAFSTGRRTPTGPEQLERPAGFPSSDKTRPDSPVPTLQGPCGQSPKRRGSLRFLPPLEVRPSSVAPDPAESRGAPPPPQDPSPLFGGRRKAVRDRLALQGGTGHFP